MGKKEAFDKKNADFSTMSVDALQPNFRLYVPKVVPKTKTSEEGPTEADAAAEMLMQNV